MPTSMIISVFLATASALSSPAGLARSLTSRVEEPSAQKWLERYEVVSLASSQTSFLRTKTSSRGSLPVVLVHGFDSSALEFRRLMSALEERNVEAYALDLVGWGFTRGHSSVSVEEKRAQLQQFTEKMGLKKYMLVGASLGGAVVIDYALSSSSSPPQTLGLIAPQCLLDGTPDFPTFLARTGVRVLASWPLRALANQLAYSDAKTFATEDAIRVGKLHVERDGWEDDQIEWLLGDGYAVSTQLDNLVDKDVAFYWGEEDKILPPEASLPILKEKLADTSSFTIYENCGHVPHLEKYEKLADDLVEKIQIGPK